MGALPPDLEQFTPGMATLAGQRPRHSEYGEENGLPVGSVSKESACSAGDPGSIPGLGRSPGEGNAIHSSILDWRMPRSEEPGGRQSMGP